MDIKVYSAHWNDLDIDQPWASSKWVRFHSLPLSKRYATNHAEADEILRRYNTILSELLKPNQDIYLFFSTWSNTSDAASSIDRSILVESGTFDHWHTYLVEDDEDEEFMSYRHIYTRKLRWNTGLLDHVFNEVARDREAGVMVMPADAAWVFMPYDGGVDILLPDDKLKHDLRIKFNSWLPQNDSGL